MMKSTIKASAQLATHIARIIEQKQADRVRSRAEIDRQREINRADRRAFLAA